MLKSKACSQTNFKHKQRAEQKQILRPKQGSLSFNKTFNLQNNCEHPGACFFSLDDDVQN